MPVAQQTPDQQAQSVCGYPRKRPNWITHLPIEITFTMNQDEVLKLLIADESLNDAEVFISVLRNAGHAVRATHIEEEDALREALGGKQYDLFICSCGLEFLSLEQATLFVQQSGRDLPIIAMAATHDRELRLKAMQHGAVDLIAKDDQEHMKRLISLEAAHLRNRRRGRQTEKALWEAERRCTALLDSSRDSIAYVHQGMYIHANPAYLERFGYAALDEIEGMPLLDMISPEDQPAFKDVLRKLGRQDSSVKDMEVTMHCDDGPQKVKLVFSAATIDGEPCNQILIRDHSDSQVLEQQLDNLSKQDLITGLLNRIHFQEMLTSAMAGKPGDSGASHGLLYLQIDNLETIRESMGPTAVDSVLAEAARLVRAELDEGGLAARFADNAFTLFLPDLSVHETVAIAEAIRNRIEETIFQAGERTITSTCSIGAVVIGERSGDMHQVLADALTACETAHAAGGNQMHLHSAASGDVDQAESSVWFDRLEDALAEDRFYLVFLPVASLTGDTRIRYEVRLRLRDDEGKEHMPEFFMNQAEKCGLANRIDRWVISRIIETLVKMQKGKQQDPGLLFTKLSGPTLSDKDFLSFLKESLNENGIAGGCLNFQVNEPVVLTQLNEARTLFKGLKELGCGFTLDHFGNSLNPFQLVKHLPAEYLKLDHNLILDLANSEEAVEERVKALIENAHSMKKMVVAGYLEDAATMARLWQHNVDLVQGNFLQAPSTEMNYNFTETVI